MRLTVEQRKTTTTDFHVDANDPCEAFAVVREGLVKPTCESEETEYVIRDVPMDDA